MGLFGERGIAGVKGEPGQNAINGDDGAHGVPGIPGVSGNKGQSGLDGVVGEQGANGSRGETGAIGAVGETGDVGEDADDGEDGEYGEVGDVGEQGETPTDDPGCGCQAREGNCKSCDMHIVTRHSQSTSIPECPAGFDSLWTGYSLVYLEGNGYSLAQELGSAGSCAESFQTVPMMQCSGGDVCQHGVRTDKSFWLSTDNSMDTPKPMNNLDEMMGFISRCNVCGGPSKIVARHSFDSSIPECPSGFHQIWNGYSYLMVTSSGASGGGQTLSSAGSCLEDFYLPTFIECLGRGTCSYYIDNIDFWLAQTQDVQPGMWGMGNVYSGIATILDEGVARCSVCAKDVRMKHMNYFKN